MARGIANQHFLPDFRPAFRPSPQVMARLGRVYLSFPLSPAWQLEYYTYGEFCPLNSKACTSDTARVVALLSPAERLGPLPLADLVVVTNGYLAAAQLLTTPARCLVVNLSRLVGPHVALLTLAERLGVGVVAYGTISAALPAAALRTVRLVGLDQVPAAVAEFLTGQAPTAPVEPVAQAPLAPPPAAPAAPAMPAKARLIPNVASAKVQPVRTPIPVQPMPAAAPAPARTRSADRFDTPASAPRPVPAAPETPTQPPAPAVPRPARPAEMLTREEIDALLEESI